MIDVAMLVLPRPLRRDRGPLLAVCVALWTATSAAAHDLGVSCESDSSGSFAVTAYFSNNAPAAQARVRVTTVDGRVVAEGTTDESGRWSFARPGGGLYFVQVDAEGHRKLTYLTVPGDPALPPKTDGPSREEFTRFPWLRLALGLGAIALLTLGIRRWLRRGASDST